MDKQESSMPFEELIRQVMDDPMQWVLFLGEGVSYYGTDYYRKKLSELTEAYVKDKGKEDSASTEVFKATQSGNFIEISDILFGSTWDGVGFLEEGQERQQECRKIYADTLAGRETIDIDAADVKLNHLLEVFSGIVLTTCQDETVEAFLEFVKSMPVDDMVCTPYIMTTSSTWDRWIKNGADDVAQLFPENEEREDLQILVKLYGTSSMPHRLLLSKEDMEDYYPIWAGRREVLHLPQTVQFMEKILQGKNIFFLGVNFSSSHSLPLADGILELLKEETGRKRYACAEEVTKEEMEDYHIRPVFGMHAAEKAYALQSRNKEASAEDKTQDAGKGPSGEGSKSEQRIITEKEVLELFGRHYIRRPCEGIFPLTEGEEKTSELNPYNARMEMELQILKRDILGIPKKDNEKKEWSESGIKKLAIAANNLADFYDLKKVFDAAAKEVAASMERGTAAFHEEVTKHMLDSRLSKDSRQLHQILEYYGQGFPLGFLQLLTDQKEELRKWKRAGIQLTNSGIYIKRHQRRRMQNRLNYADSVMQTAGTYPEEKRKQLKNKMQESRQTVNSYFYAVNNEVKTEITQEELEKIFVKMFIRLKDILRDKSDGYQQVHSLLQTETQTVFELAQRLDDEQMEWKPSLFYYLLIESRMLPPNCNTGQVDRLLEKLDEKKTDTKDDQMRLFDEKLKLYLSKIIIMSRLLETGSMDEEAVMGQYEEIDEIFFGQEAWMGNDVMPEWLFVQKVQYYFLKSRIYGRLSSMIEIDRCAREQEENKKQRQMLDGMKTNLGAAYSLIIDREKEMRCPYAELTAEYHHLFGEYLFKMSQYYMENRSYAKNDGRFWLYSKEEDCYKHAEEYYKKALDYYDKYPSQFGIQRADVMRNLADLYCQQEKALKTQMDEADRKILRNKCFDMLIEAYILYRNNSDLHGIADVLQSMGQTEDYEQALGKDSKCRSRLSFYKVSADIYKYLGDRWSQSVTMAFWKGLFRKCKTEEKNLV